MRRCLDKAAELSRGTTVAQKLAKPRGRYEQSSDCRDFTNSAAPLYAQGQQPDAANLKADAQKVVGIINGDKGKTQTYCQVANVGEQMNRAVQAKDKKKFDELAQKLPELEKNLGPEYLGLVESLGKANLTPKDGQEIVSMFDKLDDSCPQ